MELVGIDIGTTSVCGVVISAETGELLKKETVNSNAFIRGEAFEKLQSPEKIMQIATAILEKLVSEKTCAIGVTGQMHGIVYVDKQGKAVSPLYTWQDGRGNLPYKGTTYAKFLGAPTGYGNVTDFYNKENGLRPDSAVTYCTIHDYFVMQICKNKTPKIHPTDAASFGLYNLTENTWNYPVGAEIATGYAVAGKYKSIPVGVAIGDNQASVYSTVKSEKDVLLNVGTGSQVSVITEKAEGGADIEIRPFTDGKYLAVGAALCGGRAYSLLKEFFRKALSYRGEVSEEEAYEIMAEMLKREAAPLTVDTRFAGTRSNPHLTGSVSGITVDNFTPESLTAGVISGMVQELFALYQAMGEEKTGMVASGNGIRKNAFMQKEAENRFAMQVKFPLYKEEAAVGAALFSGVCAGVFASGEEARSLIKYE